MTAGNSASLLLGATHGLSNLMVSMNIFEFDHMCKKYLPVSMLPTAIELMPRYSYHCGPGIKRNR